MNGNGKTRPLPPMRQIRYLTPEELTRLRQHAEARALQAREKGTVGKGCAVRLRLVGGLSPTGHLAR